MVFLYLVWNQLFFKRSNIIIGYYCFGYYELTFMFFNDLWFRSILMYGDGSDPMTLQVMLYNFPATKYPHSRSMRACVGATEKIWNIVCSRSKISWYRSRLILISTQIFKLNNHTYALNWFVMTSLAVLLSLY